MNNYYQIANNIQNSVASILKIADIDMELEDLIRLKIIRKQMEDLGRKYNPIWFEIEDKMNFTE